MQVRNVVLSLLVIALTLTANAQEQINRFETKVVVQTDGDIEVTEIIEVTAEGNQIRRGIFRDLPRYYMLEGDRLPNDYSVRQVRRDGSAEPFEIATDGNAYRIRIGVADRFLERGEHTYEIVYVAKNQVRYFEDYDEIYWNVTGNYWAFPIAFVQVEIILPDGAAITRSEAYTGPLGETGADYTYHRQGNTHVFESTHTFEAGEGLTVALGFEKGLIDPPSGADKTRVWWQRYGSLGILFGSLAGLLWYYTRAFDRVGRDPPRQPVFPRYEPPTGYSPAAAHYIYHRSAPGHKALIATLMLLAVQGCIKIDAEKKKTTLRRNKAAALPAGLSKEDRELETGIFENVSEVTLGKKYNPSFTAAYNAFKSKLGDAYGSDYYRWNIVYVVIAVVLSGAAVIFAISQVSSWTIWHTAGILALAALNGLFMYLMPAPTVKGRAVRAEIRGFKLYMETAEKLQLNAVEVGSHTPPPMTVERYEKFLPYAVALGVEKPWTRHFEKLIPEEAAAYNPAWTNMNRQSFGNLTKLSDSLISNMSSGVSGAMPQSSSSSGSGGGGFSGGGGGGGGGGGW